MPRPPHTKRPGSTSLPTTIWLDGRPSAAGPPPVSPCTLLPTWAVDRIRAEYCRHTAGARPAERTLLHTTIRDTGPGMDARARCTAHTASPSNTDTQRPARGRDVTLLAELLVPTQSYDDESWPGFFHRAHQLLRGGGLLLTASRQHHTNGQLDDPRGTLVAHARTAGFTYLQHLIVIHARPTATP